VNDMNRPDQDYHIQQDMLLLFFFACLVMITKSIHVLSHFGYSNSSVQNMVLPKHHILMQVSYYIQKSCTIERNTLTSLSFLPAFIERITDTHEYLLENTGYENLCILYTTRIRTIVIESIQSRTLPVIYETRLVVKNTITGERVPIYRMSV
jgi:hypothetical protein